MRAFWARRRGKGGSVPLRGMQGSPRRFVAAGGMNFLTVVMPRLDRGIHDFDGGKWVQWAESLARACGEDACRGGNFSA